VLLAATLLVVSRERLTRISTWVTVATAWVVVGWAAVAAPRLGYPQHAGMRVVVAAMGHGCGIVVRSPTGRCLVYDAGRLGAPSAARRAMTAVLWHEGVNRIDTLVISHADTDHFNAVPELLDRFAVGEIVVPPPFLVSDSWAAGEVLRLARAAGIPVRAAAAGESFALDPLCRVRVLHPNAGSGDPHLHHVALKDAMGDAMATDNETSLVLAVESAGRRMLLTGDLEGDALARFIASDPDSCDVLVAPHHGSRTSLPPDIARATAADWVIVSGVGAAGWPEVRDAYAGARGDGARITVVKTGADEASMGGAIALAFTASRVRVEQFGGGRWQEVPPATSQATSAPPASGRVSSQPAAITSSWLATKPASSISTPLVNP
jgi:competence protein ComEC